jgi:NAD(P)-dependent dehydrogenase (short-subunit alcohol dehydrogenase family)
MELQDRVVVVTGGGSGIGRALALEFAGAGAKVAVCARRKERLDETVALIEQQGGVGLAVPTDITDGASVRAMIAAVIGHFGKIDILFNNAGSFASIAGVHEVDEELWWRDVTVNLLGSLLTMRAVLPHMIERDEGIIVNMNGGRPVGGSGYAAGKAGLMELTRVAVAELAMMESNVILLQAGPGLVATEMTALQAETEAGRKWIPSTAESIASGRVRKPEEIARKTIEVLSVVRLEDAGKRFGPDTDVDEFLHGKK